MPDTSDSERPLKIDVQIRCPGCGIYPNHGSLGAYYNCLLANLRRERQITGELNKKIAIREATIKNLLDEEEKRDSRINATGSVEHGKKE
jgi:hypothetical protein